jgi:N6-adenosine-specific RNA methylase IME4
VWVKKNLTKPGSGFYVRGRHELLFICTRGSFTPIDNNQSPPIGSVITSDIGEHSEKPQEAYEIIESLYPNCSYIELFARDRRSGWDSHGYEVGNEQAA